MSGYNAAFVAALRRDMDGGEARLNQQAAELVRNGEVSRLFPGRDALWLQKELSKWRSRLSSDTFNGTLQSLQLYCTLAGVTPNDVLLSSRTYCGPGQVELLSAETVLSIGSELRRGHTVPGQGYALPVLCAPGRMTTVFLFLYPRRRSGEDTVIGRFGLSEPEGFADVDGSDCTGGVHTALDSSLYAADLFLDDWQDRLMSAYNKIRREFEAVCAAADSPLHDAANAFYTMMGDWTDRHRDGGDLLFSWYPPAPRRSTLSGTLDGLSAVVRSHTAERER